jgi:hypothetical protein
LLTVNRITVTHITHIHANVPARIPATPNPTPPEENIARPPDFGDALGERVGLRERVGLGELEAEQSSSQARVASSMAHSAYLRTSLKHVPHWHWDDSAGHHAAFTSWQDKPCRPVEVPESRIASVRQVWQSAASA